MRAKTWIPVLLALVLITGIAALAPLKNDAVRAANRYSDRLTACPDGYVWITEVNLDPGGYDFVNIISANPPGTTGFVLEAYTPGYHRGEFRGRWNTPQAIGTVVTVTASAERPDPVTVVQTAVVTANGCEGFGDGPFNPGDDRVSPQPTDRLAIYCDAEYLEFEVWGIRPDGSGYRLTIFPFDELTGAGKRGVRRTTRDGSVVIASIDAVQPIFSVAWYGGPYNALGRFEFAKTFACPFEWTRLPTPTPVPRAPRLPVITLTPSPTPTAVPTRPGF